jgi:tetratricopeptide (TPR) repeat protein
MGAKPSKPATESATLRRVTKLSEILGSLSTIVSSVVLMAALAVVFSLGVREALRDAIVMDPIEMPKDVVELGYSPQVFTSRLEDARRKIEADAKTSLKRRQLVTAWTQTNFDIPGAGFSVKAAIGFARQALGFSEKHIGGDATRDGKDFVLVLRGPGAAGDEPVRVRAAGIDELAQRGAEAIVKIVEPYVLAAYYYDLEEPDAAFKTTLELIAYCLEHAPAADDRRAYDLWGQVLAKKDDTAGAIAKYQKALSLEPKDAFAHNEWGTILVDENKPDEAIEHYKRALAISPDDVSIISSNICNALNVAGRHEEALAKCNDAIAADPKYASAYHNAGVALENLKRFDEAVEHYRKARTLGPKLKPPCVGWSNALKGLGRNATTDAAYQSLCGTSS